MKKVITFLGKYPKETSYQFQGKVYTGKVFSEALRQFVEFDKMLVFVTDEARETTWPVLKLLNDKRIVPIPIPVGENTNELWALFDSLIEQVEEGDVLVFDITHGLRSIPFLTFLAAAYLRAARNVVIEAIYYGAYELGQPAPVIDLSKFVSLLDWLTAANQFIYTGDARYLASQLRKEGEARDSDSLRMAGKQLEKFSLAMMLCRPIEIMEEAGKLGEVLDKAEDELQEGARPFALLAQRIKAEYQNRSVDDSQKNVAENLKQQYHLILWYLENNQIIQAITLAREWVISLIGWRQGLGFLIAKDKREVTEKQLGRLASQESAVSEEQALLDAGLKAKEIQLFKSLWSHLTTVRNDLDHAGMRRNAKPAQQLAREAQKKLRKKIQQIAEACGVSGPDESLVRQPITQKSQRHIP